MNTEKGAKWDFSKKPNQAGFIYSTEPRNADFGIIFIIVAAFIIAMIFGLVFISYELVNMGPGDNIAYKLGAAATKKNQELCFSSYNRNMSLVLSKFAQ